MPGPCTKNPQKKWFGFVSYEGEHEWVEHSLWRTTDYVYTLVMECGLCGAREDDMWRDADMLRLGFNLEQLRTLKSMSMENPVLAENFAEYREAADG